MTSQNQGAPLNQRDEPTLRDLLPASVSEDAGNARSRVRQRLDADLCAAADALSQRLGDAALPFAGAWVLTLSRLLGMDRMRLAVSGNAREVRIAGELTVSAWLAQLSDALHSSGQPSEPDLPGWSSDLSPAQPDGSVIAGREAGDVIAIDFPANYSPEGMARVLATWKQLLGELVAHADSPLSALQTLDTDQRERLRYTLNDTGWTYDGPMSVHARFSAVAARHPDRVALAWEEEALSYAELEHASDALAMRLRDDGVLAGDIVALGLGRSPEAIIAMLAVLKLGAAYLPVDLHYPPERLAFMLGDAGVQLLLAPHAATALPPGVRTLVLEGVPSPAPRQASPMVEPSALAYVMYTSGSTGEPKGVQIPHRAILRLVMQCEFMTLDESVRMLHAAPPGFDASTLEIWGPLLNGGVCVLHDEDIPTAAGLARTISWHGVTSAWLTAALFNAVVDEDPHALSGLKELLAGGEALSRPHVRRAMQALPRLRLINGYGPTECTTFTTTHAIQAADLDAASIPIGRPITETQVYICNSKLELLPDGLVGELLVGGLGVGLGYLNRAELNAQKFVADTIGSSGGLLYRTGDLVRRRDDGAIEFIGRVDNQVKIRGFRIEPGEIEAVLAAHPQVRSCAVVPLKDANLGTQLVGYVVAPAADFSAARLREFLHERLPEFMVPAHFVRLDALPVTQNGKLDRRALPAPARVRPDDLPQPFVPAANDLEQRVAAVLAGILGIDRVGQLDNFFELGGNSLAVVRALSRLRDAGLPAVAPAAFFANPTARSLASALGGGAATLDARRLARKPISLEQGAIAIVGMAGRFPGAASVEELWDVLVEGRDTIRMFKPEELDASIPASLRADSNYVAARGVVDGCDLFDAAFFGISPKEAELIDPQQRLFLELCWEALERGGHTPESYAAPIGVFGGMYNPTYFQRHVQHRPDLIEKVGEFQVMLGNEKDYVATRVAHRLNLTGPAISVHTACSTSLVAICVALESLRNGQCGMALAGGASITCPPRSGYLYNEGSMLSPDGHTRTFDADAQGTVFSDGAAVVLLKRLEDAIADGNPVYAVIRGGAVNNDGGDKASFTAPSVEGQAAVVAAALDRAGVDARTISYVEAHGTATPLGDPVEIAGLTQAYRRHTQDDGYCLIGSVKSNLGHTVIAAGATGLIKTAMALAQEKLPASIHYRAPNPKIELDKSPFRVVDRLTAWPRGETPRRAGVSAFGVGGTNAHVVLEEAPALPESSTATAPQLLKISARTRAALEAAARRLADHLERHPRENLADVAYTLDVGRRAFGHRAAVVAADTASAVRALRDGATLRAARQAGAPAGAVYLFPGQGAQYPGMGSGLYDTLPVFRAAFDECLAAFEGLLAFDLKQAMFGDDAALLARTEVLQPVMFCLEYSLARLWMEQGVKPTALIGHSIGEFVAATLAQVMSLRDAAHLVARRGALMQAQPAGSMLSVRVDADTLEPMIPAGLQLCADNGLTACVVGGPTAEVEAFAAELTRRDIASRMLVTSHAFHTPMMDAALAPFREEVRKVALHPPQLPIISTRTGAPLTAAQATDPEYWIGQLRDPVRFRGAIRHALDDGAALFLELGPRGSLSALVRQHDKIIKDKIPAVAVLADSPESELASVAAAAGLLWTAGLALSWRPESGHRRRVLLPTYPFERQRFWVEAAIREPVPAIPPATHVTTLPVSPPPADPLASPQAIIQMLTAALPAAAEPIHTTLTDSNTAMNAIPTAALAGDRRPNLIARLREVFEDTSGVEMGDADSAATFVELGLDSLTLTQVALQLKKNFSVAITFRDLMENHSSLEALADFLDQQLPAEVAAAPAPAPVAAAPQAAEAAAMTVPTIPPTGFGQPFQIPAGVPAGSPLLQQLIQQQMALMASQLALLGGMAQQVQALPPAAPAMPPAAAAAPVAQAVASAPKPVAVKPAAPTSADEEAALAHTKYDVKKAFGAIARIHTSGTELTERQRSRLDAFMKRYIEKTKKSKAYTVEHRPHLADPRVVNGFRPQLKEIIYQIVIERSKGARMWDIDGNEYVDALNGFGMSLFGWQPDFVLEAVKKQLDSGYDIGPQHPLAGEVAKLFCEVTGNDRAGLCNTGSEAVMGCVRIARTITGRSKIVIFSGAYHGIFDEVIVRGTKKLKSIPAAPGILPNTAENVVVLDYGTPESLKWIQDNAQELAAVLVETVQSRRPDFQPIEFLKSLREVTSKSGSLLIFDEVVTGFRSHPGGIQALFGIKADLASYGKVVGGGFPIGVIAGKREYMDALDGGHWEFGDNSIPTVGVTYFAGTFVRHPLALVAAKAVLEHVKKEGPALQQTLNQKVTDMVAELNAYCREVGAPITLKSFASVWKVFFDEDHPLQDLLFAMMRNRGIHILDNFPCFFTTAHTAEDFARIKTAFKESVAELIASDFIPGRVVAPPKLFDANKPPVPGARLGRDANGNPGWFVANPDAPGKFMMVEAK
ncbi:MAG TPA: amino acid adenylation domain-containing protein [Steroidobacteraceae bacterium]|nr:amino acid adenylation domain-containing protein [Steroidobacteraceae bacterium]